MKKGKMIAFLAAAVTAVGALAVPVTADTETEEKWVYEHDPMENPAAANGCGFTSGTGIVLPIRP